MSFLFGKKKQPQKAPSTGDAIQKLRQTEELLEKKQAFLETKIKQELQVAKQNGTRNKRAAIMALKRKKRLEKQLDQIDGTLSTIEYQREALENANTSTEVINTMGFAAKALKAAQQNMGVEDVDDLMSDIQEQMEVANEITDAISNQMGFGQDVDEDELFKELEELEQEELDEQLLSVGPSVAPQLPDVPTERPAKVADQEDEDMRELAAWAS
ncbi:charged multivesicular body protein 4b-like [Acanthaster planci]|uniref:Charged multivesicular body protein 4b-like n=1 Tax=Acanthaster planci TaxID=133434 RepID=A0A8B7YPF6_ACAPL|nr:charged multivesicular body protein 4b-like [Acanthaster planci]